MTRCQEPLSAMAHPYVFFDLANDPAKQHDVLAENFWKSTGHAQDLIRGCCGAVGPAAGAHGDGRRRHRRTAGGPRLRSAAVDGRAESAQTHDFVDDPAGRPVDVVAVRETAEADADRRRSQRLADPHRA